MYGVELGHAPSEADGGRCRLMQRLCRIATVDRAATKGWVLYCSKMHVHKQVGRGNTQNNTMRRVKQRSAAAAVHVHVAGLLL